MTNCVLMIAGQSNGTQMCVVPVAGCAPVAGVYVWSGTWRAMTSSDGAGMITLANTLRANGCDEVYVYDCCYGGSSVVPVAASPSTNCWQNSNPPVTDCLAQVAAGGRVPQVVIWMQGEQEAQYSSLNPSFDMVGSYKASLDQARLFLLGRWGVSAAQCPWMVTPVGYVSYGNPLPVRQSQQQYVAAGVVQGPARDDLALLNEGGVFVHLTGPSCRTFAERLAPILIEALTMTDPQDKAAIASLQAAIASLQAGIENLQGTLASITNTLGSIQLSISRLQFSATILDTRLSAMEVIARDGPIGPYGEHGYSC